jgi:hypothetical protein
VGFEVVALVADVEAVVVEAVVCAAVVFAAVVAVSVLPAQADIASITVASVRNREIIFFITFPPVRTSYIFMI